jgi:hypothetical protein
MEAGANGHGTLAGKGRRRWFGAQIACRHYCRRTGALQHSDGTDARRLGAILASGLVLNIDGFSDAVFSVFAAFLAGFPVRDPTEVERIERTLCRPRAWRGWSNRPDGLVDYPLQVVRKVNRFPPAFDLAKPRFARQAL